MIPSLEILIELDHQAEYVQRWQQHDFDAALFLKDVPIAWQRFEPVLNASCVRDDSYAEVFVHRKGKTPTQPAPAR